MWREPHWGHFIQPTGAESSAQDFYTPLVNKRPFDAPSASKTWMTTQSCDQSEEVPAVHTYSKDTDTDLRYFPTGIETNVN